VSRPPFVLRLAAFVLGFVMAWQAMGWLERKLTAEPKQLCVAVPYELSSKPTCVEVEADHVKRTL